MGDQLVPLGRGQAVPQGQGQAGGGGGDQLVPFGQNQPLRSFPRERKYASRGTLIAAEPSPNGAMVAVMERVSGHAPNPPLYITRIVDRNNVSILHLDLYSRQFIWSPDSQRLIVIVERGDRAVLVGVGAAGAAGAVGPITVISHDIPWVPWDEQPRVWSPDSLRFVVQWRVGDFRVYDRNANISKEFSSYGAQMIDWSPDNKHILMDKGPVVGEIVMEVREVGEMGSGDVSAHVRHRVSAEGGPMYVLKTAWATDSENIALVTFQSSQAYVTVWNTKTNAIHTLKVLGNPKDISWSANSKVLAVACGSNLSLFRKGDYGRPYVLEVPTTRVQWSKNGKTTLVSIGGGHVRIYRDNSEQPSTIQLPFREIELPKYYGYKGQLLSPDNDWIFGRDDTSFRSMYLHKWSDKTNMMFNQEFRRIVFILMNISKKLDERRIPIPRLPTEVWLLVFEQLARTYF